MSTGSSVNTVSAPVEAPAASGSTIFLAHAESEKRFVERVKDRTLSLSRSRRIRRAGVAKGTQPRPRPTLYYDKDTFSFSRDSSLRSFTSAASTCDTFVVFVPEGGFHPRSFVGKELLAFMTGRTHRTRDEIDPVPLTDDERRRALEKTNKVLFVDRSGALRWEGGEAPAALPAVCRQGVLQDYFRVERARLQTESARPDEIAIAVLAQLWAVTPETVRSRVAARQRQINLMIVMAAVMMAALAVVATFEYRSAEHARSEADREASRALEALGTATDQACASMSAEARALLPDRPAWAVGLAWAADDLCRTYSSVSVERDALALDPAWSMLPPDPPRAGLTVADLWTSVREASFAADPALRRAVSTMPAPKDDSQGNAVVWDVDSAATLGSLDLAPDEHLIGGFDAASQVFATRRGDGMRLWDWGQSGMPRAAHSEDHALAWSCASGSWPCAILRPNGAVVMLATPAARPTELGRWSGASDLSLSRSGQAVAVVLPGRVQWFSVASPADGEQSVPTGERGLHPPMLAWGPGDHDLFIVDDDSGPPGAGQVKLRLRAWHVGAPAALVASTNDNFRPIAPAVQGSRIAWFCPNPSSEEGNQMCIYDLGWHDSAAPTIAQYTLDEGHEAASFREIAEAALAPRGNYLVLIASHSGTSGLTTSSSSVESWDLTPIGSDTDEVPIPARLARHHDSPLARTVYSHDGGRVAAWHEDGVVEVWRVRTDAPPPLQQKLRIPDAILERLLPSVLPIDSLRSRWVVRFAADDHEIVAPGATLSLEDRFPGETVLAAQPDGEGALVVVTSQRLLALSPTVWDVKREVRFTAPARGACTTGTLLVVNHGDVATIFRVSGAVALARLRLDTLPPEAAGELACTGDASHPPPPGLPSSLPVAELADGRLLLFYVTGAGTIHGVVETVVAGVGTPSNDWRVELGEDFKANFGVHVARDRGLVFLGSFGGGFHVVDALTGVPDAHFPRPSTGWPPSGPMAGWEDRDGVHLLFRGDPMQLWSSGAPHAMTDLPGSEPVEAWTENGVVQLALQEDEVEEQDQSRVVWDTHRATAAWKGDVVSSTIPTPPEASGGQSPAGLDRMGRSVLRGGRLDMLTRVPLPAKTAERLARLTKQLATLRTGRR